MPNRVPQFRLKSLAGLVLVSGFSLIVWLAVAFGIAQLRAGHGPCDKGDHSPAAQACHTDDR